MLELFAIVSAIAPINSASHERSLLTIVSYVSVVILVHRFEYVFEEGVGIFEGYKYPVSKRRKFLDEVDVSLRWSIFLKPRLRLGRSRYPRRR